MNAQSLKYMEVTSQDTHSATSLQGSVDGLMPCNSQDGPQMNLSGQEVAHASLSVAPERGKEPQTNDTYGPSLPVSLASADLQRSLASRLRVRLGVNGSLEYSLTWKEWDMPQREPICALRASVRRMLDSDFSGWPTTNTMDHIERDGLRPSREATGRTGGYLAEVVTQLAGYPTAKARDHHCEGNGKYSPSLATVAELAGYNTPRATDGSNGGPNQANGALSADAAMVAGYCTPASRDWKDTPGMATTGVNPDGSMRNHMDQLPRQVSGAISTSFPSATEKRGALNPEHSRWLMGYPTAWSSCAVTAMQSFPRSRRSS